jgi:G3E family GTPase
VLVGVAAAARPGGHGPEAGAPDAHAHFAQAQIALPSRLTRAACVRALEGLPRSVLRAKGFVRLCDAPGVMTLVQKVGPRWNLTPFPEGARPLPEGRLVLVGTPDMPAPEALAALFAGQD